MKRRWWLCAVQGHDSRQLASPKTRFPFSTTLTSISISIWLPKPMISDQWTESPCLVFDTDFYFSQCVWISRLDSLHFDNWLALVGEAVSPAHRKVTSNLPSQTLRLCPLTQCRRSKNHCFFLSLALCVHWCSAETAATEAKNGSHHLSILFLKCNSAVRQQQPQHSLGNLPIMFHKLKPA